MKILTAILMLAAFGVSAADAIVGLGGMTVSDFKYKGDGYLLEGKKATTIGDRIHIHDAKATVVKDDDVLIIESPMVVFNRATQRGSGDNDVKITTKSERLEMTGKGFDADFRRQRVRIRRNAKMTLYNVTAKDLKKATNRQ